MIASLVIVVLSRGAVAEIGEHTELVDRRGDYARLARSGLIGLNEPSLRAVRGREGGAVFQDALAALNPVHTIGAQLDEAVRNTGAAQPGRERHRTWTCSVPSACPTRLPSPQVTPPALRRHAPAGS